MALHSRLFNGDAALEACLVHDSAHVLQGATGEHVKKIQTALTILESQAIDPAEMAQGKYGPSTAAAVSNYKKKRKIINFSYQNQVDNIVGKMTIAALDKELLALAGPARNKLRPVCERAGKITT